MIDGGRNGRGRNLPPHPSAPPTLGGWIGGESFQKGFIMTVYTVCHRVGGIEVTTSIHSDRDDAETAADIYRINAEEGGADRSYYIKEKWCSMR